MLETAKNQIIAELKQGNSTRLIEKLQIDDAIASLKLCERHSITASAKVIELPETRTRTPSSEYRVLEDHETEDREIWTELIIANEAIRPSPGALLVETGNWPQSGAPEQKMEFE